MKFRTPKSTGFTLFELIVVMAIIAAMVTVAVPYATRSNKGLKVRQECLSLTQAVKYVAELAEHTRRPARIVIDEKNKYFLLEAATGTDEYSYKLIEDFGGGIRHLDPEVEITDITGFKADGRGLCLVFEPAEPWPSASITLMSENTAKRITIRGKRVEVSDDSDVQQERNQARNLPQR
ncbi:MAG: pilus assembly FimT family protein [Planctomycetota bacterium]|jgi:prepilin-type N-terminal cleavage/methylation domain-containing protein